MNSYVVKDRALLWISGLCFAVGIAVSVYMYPAGIWTSITMMTLCTMVAAIFAHEGMRTTIISEEGICEKTPLKTTKVRWDQINRAGVARLRIGRSVKQRIFLNYPGDPEKKHWVLRWLWFLKLENTQGFLFLYKDELRDLIIKYYGPLDVDLSDSGNAF